MLWVSCVSFETKLFQHATVKIFSQGAELFVIPRTFQTVSVSVLLQPFTSFMEKFLQVLSEKLKENS